MLMCRLFKPFHRRLARPERQAFQNPLNRSMMWTVLPHRIIAAISIHHSPFEFRHSDFPMPLQIYISGKYYDKEDAKVSVYDHGLLYGDGVFEGMRSYSGKVFRLKAHLGRLWDSAKAIWLTVPMTQEALAQAVNDTLAKNGIQDGYIRLIVTRGAG